MTTQIIQPYQQFFDTDGDPLDNGSIYIGSVGSNPQTGQIVVYWDDALTLPASQPLKTSGGRIVRSGTPVRVYTSADDFSMSVYSKRGDLVFYEASVSGAGSIRQDLANSSDSAKGDALVAAKQPYVGAVARVVHDKMVEVLSVKDFGAVGDGVADDTTAIQAAIDAGKPYSTTTSGLLIYFPPGRYKTSNSIDISSCHGLHLAGAGPYATEVFTVGTNQVFKAIGSSAVPLNKASITDMTIRGGGLANTSAHGIDLQWANHCYLHNLVFFSCRNALNLSHQWQTSLRDVSVHGAGADQSYIGVYMDATNVAHIDNTVQAVNVFVQSTSFTGFRLINAQGSKFTNCEAGGSPMVYAWYIGDPPSGTAPCQWIHFSNCLGDSVSGATWLLRQGTASEISEMHLVNCWAGNGWDGFYLDGCRNMTFGNLLSVGHARAGVLLNNCQQVLIGNSVFRNNNENASASNADAMLQNSIYCTIHGCESEGTGVGKSLIETGTSNSNNIYGNNLFMGATIIGGLTQCFRNRGFRTETRGQIDVLAASTSVTVTHSLGITPDLSCISVTPKTGLGTAKFFWIDNATATTFRINVNAAPGVNIGFCWQADLVATQ